MACGLILDVDVNSYRRVRRQNTFVVNDFYTIEVEVHYPSTFTGELFGIGNINNSSATIHSQTVSNFSGTATFVIGWQADEVDFYLFSNVGSLEIRSVFITQTPSDAVIQIRDHNDDLAATIPAGSINIVTEATAGGKNLYQVCFYWSNLAINTGCYAIWVFDSDPNGTTVTALEDDFTGDMGWSLDTNSQITGGQLVQGASTIGGLAEASFPAAVQSGQEYTVTFEITEISGSVLTVALGNAVHNPGFTTTGIKSVTLTADGTDLRFLNALASPGGGSKVTDVKVTFAATIPDAKSQMFDVQDSHDCTLFFEWRNNENFLGYNYETGVARSFFHRMRVQAELDYMPGEQQKEIGLTSNGVKSMDYAMYRLKKLLRVFPCKGHVHEALEAAFAADKVLVDSMEMIMPDEYDASPVQGKMWKSENEVELISQTNTFNRNE